MIPKEYYPIISDYIKILVPSFITYLVTKYTFTRQRRYEIKEKQFNLIYLPLYLLNEQYKEGLQSNTEETLNLYIKKVEKLFYKNRQYVYSKTITLFESLKRRKKASSIYTFCSQTNFDYEVIKKELGYPAGNFFDTYRHLTRFDKLLYALFIVSIGVFILLITAAFSMLLSGELLSGFSTLVYSIFLLFPIWILRLITKG